MQIQLQRTYCVCFACDIAFALVLMSFRFQNLEKGRFENWFRYLSSFPLAQGFVPVVKTALCKRLFLSRVNSAVVTGGPGGRAPLTTACASPFRFTQNTFLKHHVTTRQQIIMEQRIITLKDNSRLKFSRFFAKLLATNCCT